MSFFIKRKLKDGRRIRGRCNYDTNKVLISQDDFEGLLNESDVAYEQAKQLQIIIENLQEIKAESIRKTLDKIRAEIEQIEINDHRDVECLIDRDTVLNIINKYKVKSEDRE